MSMMAAADRLLVAAGRFMMTIMSAMMLRMNVFTCGSLRESCHIGTS